MSYCPRPFGYRIAVPLQQIHNRYMYDNASGGHSHICCNHSLDWALDVVYSKILHFLDGTEAGKWHSPLFLCFFEEWSMTGHP